MPAFSASAIVLKLLWD